MRKWIYSAAQNTGVVAMGVVYSCPLLFAGTNTIDRLEPEEQTLTITCETAVAPCLIDERLRLSIRFQGLVSQWHAERGATSSITRMAQCNAYQSIIGMGAQAVPLIVARLQAEGDEPDQWFPALRIITDEDPVALADRGDMSKMAEAWLRWWAANPDYAG